MFADANVLLVLAIILVFGTLFGTLAKLLNLPSVTGQIVAGILIGGSVLKLLTNESIHELRPLVEFALGLMAVSVGSHLNFRRLQVAQRRLALLLLFEATLTPAFVYFGLTLFTSIAWYTALMLATIAISTAPATVLAIVKETASRGAFVTTMIAGVAFNNLVCIIFFEVARTIARTAIVPAGAPLLQSLTVPFMQIGESILIGAAIGTLLILLSWRVVRADRLAVLSLIAILLTTGLTAQLGLSVLLACLSLGVTLANLTPDREEIGHRVFDRFEAAIFAVFFTIAGIELQFDKVIIAGALAIIAFTGRLAGKILAGYLGMRLAGATTRFRKWLGMSLAPQAGLAVGLMLLVTEDEVFASIHEVFLAVVLATVLLNETVGPILTKTALKKSGDFGRDRSRMLDFLSEQNITTNLKGPDKATAIRQLVDLTVRVHELPIDAEKIFQAVMSGEEKASTCVGEGLALPHARLDVGEKIIGAMGISRTGLDIPTPDMRPVHCMVLILTPNSMPERHLEVLSALTASIGRDWTIQQRLYHIDSPAHADELIHLDQQFEDWNYYLDDH